MKKLIAVIGASDCDEKTFRGAWRVGELLAEGGCDVVTGGLTGVMEGASAGARDKGANVIGILPGDDPAAANPHVTAVVATGMGDARNAIIANSAAGFVALPGGEGTLSEIAFALKRGKPIVSLGSWDIDSRVHRAETPEAAVEWLLKQIG
jgi:uncharacterized protein (TIGR00725 family)